MDFSDGRSKRDRLMGRLFGGKEKKETQIEAAANVDDFLRNTSDDLSVAHPVPPPPPSALPKLDTTISRYPQALAVNQSMPVQQTSRPSSSSRQEQQPPSPRKPRPNRKGQHVTFMNGPPAVIGVGGDECEFPVMEIAKSKPKRSPSAPAGPFKPSPTKRRPAPLSSEPFTQPPLRRAATGNGGVFSPVSPPIGSDDSAPEVSPLSPISMNLMPARDNDTLFVPKGSKDDNRRSFIEMQSAQMRQDEGLAFAKAVRVNSVAYTGNWEDGAPPGMGTMPISPDPKRPLRESPESMSHQAHGDGSPSASIHSNVSALAPQPAPYSSNPISRQTSTISTMSRVDRADAGQLHTRMASVRLQDSMNAAGGDALSLFVTRTTHLYELFRLHAETVRSIPSSSPKDASRASLWWFLRGRMGLEIAVRERPTTPQSQMQNEMDRQQAYTNLSKSYWLAEEMIPEILQIHGAVAEPEVDVVRQQVVSALTKLSMSMKRNGFLPPEETFLPQTVDKFIWVEYPAVSQDMLGLLSGNWGSGMSAMQQPLVSLQLMDALPLGDTVDHFSYGRVMVDAYLMEQGRESQQLYFPCMLSMVRPQRDMGLIFVLASQNGIVQMAIQDSRGSGPTWKDIRWRNEACCLEMRLPRGFILNIQMSQQDYRMLWNMYDFGAKVRSTLQPRPDEVMVFQNTIRSFQYIDADPQSRIFPKEPVQFCDVALFERVRKVNGPSGMRTFHAGCRIAAVTGPRTRTLSSVHHSYNPDMPIQFGFFRGEDQCPALSVRFDNGRQRGRMVLVFGDEKERVRFHSLLTGTDLDADERIFCNVFLKSHMISQSLREPRGMMPFAGLPWNAARVVNDQLGPSGDQPSTVLADKLKIVLEYQSGTITDRVNVDTGELRMRVDAAYPCMLRLLRQPQHDITMACLEMPSPNDHPSQMAEALRLINTSQTIRTLEFNTIKDLHDFQFAITGYRVVFDGVASLFAIARRRSVVPIHKKWEAEKTRIQIVRNGDGHVQLLAFFEDFQYGHCMGFQLKGTDVYESFSKSSKAGIKIVDAKFPLPRLPEDKNADFDDMAFVCLDLPDLPGEHDDISIFFDTEAERDMLCGCLPADVKGASRLGARLLKNNSG
ncbi:hypothetical protein VHEMI10504 [[Torrubiella] hemipterigena]|uniref:Uncharacterized protein n=1 Tax=[Torrubiella] hemipterigena TaxID=1531966 RepID=A0A0A1TRZ0_9HYPO|nr:hypothetical protein VHEMI10504 [[Torrubiella] hemipterigena]